MGIDQNNNGIADSLDREIADRVANGTAQDFASVTVTLKAAPTTEDVADFVSCGGYLTTDLWTKATYGFGGLITYNEIASFTRRCSDVLLVEREAVGEACVAYAAKQVGARTYVWNTLGLQGDPNSSIAIVDTGIDGSHADFSPGYGDQDFSKKIVGWDDQVDSTTSPIDDDGHGSHCAGLAAGDGFFSVDASGYATATWGTVATLSTGYVGWSWSGMMVNKTGAITLSVKWWSTGTIKLNAFSIYKSGKSLTSWNQVLSKSAPSSNAWDSLSYNVVSSPSGGYDTYNPRIDYTGGTGELYVVLNMSWPYTPPADGFSVWTGIAPQSKLVGVRVLGSTDSTLTWAVFGNRLISGVNWIISNRVKYHITVASMSIGFSSAGIENSTIDSVIANLVGSGVTTVVAAGNEETGYNNIYTPASVDEVITVAAMNQFDSITDYSSQGGTSRATGKTTKPDITAPGGSGAYGPGLFSADTNYNDAEGGFADVQANDAAPMQGTSMAAPIISGCAQVVIQAMGGYAGWNYTRSQALQPKMLLLMTATETYPNLREGGTVSTSPTLNRGGKDVHEGYGRVNLDAAVDALVKSYTIGSVATDSLGRPPTTSDISFVGQRLVWARNVQLAAGPAYSFSLSVPAGADYDLYLYNSTGTTYGEPAIVAQSTNATTGGTEQFWVTAPYTGTYYIVVKRATETTGSGTFSLSSSGPSPVSVTLNTPGLTSAPNVVHYVQNGVPKTGNISANTFSDDADMGSTLSIDNPIYVSATQRYITTDPAAFIVGPGTTFTANYKTQYNITVTSSHGSPTASQWVDSGNNFAASVTSPEGSATHHWVCTGYSIDGGAAITGTSYTFTSVNAGHTIVFNWQEQWYITVTSDHDSPTASAWANSGSNFVASVASPADVVAGDSQWVCTGYNLDGGSSQSGTSYIFTNVQAAHTIVFNWKKQFCLTVSSAYGSPNGGFYDPGTTANAVLASGTVSGGNGVQYIFTGWSGDASGTDLTSNGIVMNSAKTATANWKTQYYLTVSSAYGSPSGGGWYDSGSAASAALSSETASGGAGIQYIFTGWSGDASGTGLTSSDITMSSPKTTTANWKTQYYMTVSSAYGTAEGEGWYDSDTSVSATVTESTVAGITGTQYVFTGWGGDASGSSPSSDALIMNGPKTATANWKTQYYLTVISDYGSPTPASSWFDAGTHIEASVSSPAAASVLTQNVCTGWAGTGSAPASGTDNSVPFTIDQPTSITWNWRTEILPLNLAVIIAVPVVLAVIAVSLLLCRSRKRKMAGGIPQPSLTPPPPPPPVA